MYDYLSISLSVICSEYIRQFVLNDCEYHQSESQQRYRKKIKICGHDGGGGDDNDDDDGVGSAGASAGDVYQHQCCCIVLTVCAGLKLRTEPEVVSIVILENSNVDFEIV